jgi:hypothetical protein
MFGQNFNEFKNFSDILRSIKKELVKKNSASLEEI